MDEGAGNERDGDFGSRGRPIKRESTIRARSAKNESAADP